MKVACIGTGLIGSGWAAHFARAGLEVICQDPRPEAEGFLRETLKAAWPTLEKLGLAPGASPAKVAFTTDLKKAINDADFIQESAFEDEAFKIDLLAQIDALAKADALILSSSSGFLGERLRSRCKSGGRVLIGHPFNPPYLIPLVEVVGGKGADPKAVERAVAFYRQTGSRPIVLKNEIEGYIGNRLQTAVWREILYMLEKDVADVKALDEAMTYGPALRWSALGPSEAFWLGARTPSEYPRFLKLMLDELAPFFAPADFVPSPELAALYEKEVRAAWGTRDPADLKQRRDRLVTALRKVQE